MIEYAVEKPNVREMALEHGIEFSFDEDLISMILGTGSKTMSVGKMSRKILETLNDSNDEELVENLMSLPGVGEGKALQIAAAIELGKRRSNHLRAPINCPSDIIPFLQNYAVSNKERFIVVSLNGGHEIIDIHVVSVGTLNCSRIHPREIFLDAIKENAAALVLCHNHPSGNVKPSDADIKTTKNLLKASCILGIEILDHVIIDRDKYYSFVENNLLFTSDE